MIYLNKVGLFIIISPMFHYQKRFKKWIKAKDVETQTSNFLIGIVLLLLLIMLHYLIWLSAIV